MRSGPDRARRAAIVLCGGESRRMGRDKAELPFAGQSMLAHMTKIVGTTVAATVVVKSPSQMLPGDLPPVTIGVDRRAHGGPLEGLTAGWACLAADVEAVFACGCDLPLLRPAVVERLFSRLDDYDAVVPRIGRQAHPLAAVYARRVGTQVAACLAAKRRSMHALVERLNVRWITSDELSEVDPQLESLLNVNRLEDYRRALEARG